MLTHTRAHAQACTHVAAWQGHSMPLRAQGGSSKCVAGLWCAGRHGGAQCFDRLGGASGSAHVLQGVAWGPRHV